MTTVTQTAKPIAGTGSRGAPLEPVYTQIRDLIYQASGIYTPDDKLYLVADGAGRRIKQVGSRSASDYWNLLNAAATREAELRQLLNEVTIGETCLFRSQAQLDALRKVILPELVADKSRQFTKRLRIWSAGCSTGEEPYTLAMSLLEECEGALKGWQFEIAATDLNDRSVETAKTGIYGDYAMRNTTDQYKKKYFTPAEGGKFQVRPELKKLVTFNRLNLQDDAKMQFMKGMDLIFCCNVLIYFDNASKSRVVSHFFNNLTAGGYFFLGSSESLLRLNDQFHLVHFPGTIGYWKPAAAKAEKSA